MQLFSILFLRQPECTRRLNIYRYVYLFLILKWAFWTYKLFVSAQVRKTDCTFIFDSKWSVIRVKSWTVAKFGSHHKSLEYLDSHIVIGYKVDGGSCIGWAHSIRRILLEFCRWKMVSLFGAKMEWNCLHQTLFPFQQRL